MSEAFEAVEIFREARPSTHDAIVSIASLRRVKRGEHLFRDKEPVHTLYALVSGWASLYKINSIGEKKVIFVYGKGKMLNEAMLQKLPASINCEMLEESVVMALPRVLWHRKLLLNSSRWQNRINFAGFKKAMMTVI